MSQDLGSASVVLKVSERTRQVVLFAKLGADPELCAYRERVHALSDGSVFKSEDAGTVQRRLSAIAGTSFTAGGVTVSGAQLAGLIAQAADDLRNEDIATAKAAAEAAAKAAADAAASEAAARAADEAAPTAPAGG